jgi:hypothetical protein
MPWIDIPPDDADAQIARLTKHWTVDQERPVPGVIAPMKHRARTMRAVLQLNAAVTFGGSSLGHVREELIATTVSALNDCFY